LGWELCARPNAPGVADWSLFTETCASGGAAPHKPRDQIKRGPPMADERPTWVHDCTFGGKAKDFWWRVEENGDITIRRVFATRGQRDDVRVRTVTREELGRLLDAMSDGEWWPLANSVEKLTNGTEQHGLGKFLYEQLGWTCTEAQLAGHLGVILTSAGVWEWNDRKRDMKFRLADPDLRRMQAYFERRRSRSLRDLPSF